MFSSDDFSVCAAGRRRWRRMRRGPRPRTSWSGHRHGWDLQSSAPPLHPSPPLSPLARPLPSALPPLISSPPHLSPLSPYTGRRRRRRAPRLRPLLRGLLRRRRRAGREGRSGAESPGGFGGHPQAAGAGISYPGMNINRDVQYSVPVVSFLPVVPGRSRLAVVRLPVVMACALRAPASRACTRCLPAGGAGGHPRHRSASGEKAPHPLSPLPACPTTSHAFPSSTHPLLPTPYPPPTHRSPNSPKHGTTSRACGSSARFSGADPTRFFLEIPPHGLRSLTHAKSEKNSQRSAENPRLERGATDGLTSVRWIDLSGFC